MSDRMKRYLFALMILAGFTAALLVVSLLGREYGRGERESVPYSGTLLRYEGWTALREDGPPRRVSPPAYVSPEKGSLTVANTLPRALESGTYLVFESTNTLASVTVGGAEIYRNAGE